MPTNVLSYPGPPMSFAPAGLITTVLTDDAEGDSCYRVEATLETTPSIFPHVPADVYLTCKNQLGLTDILLVPVHPIENSDPKNYTSNIAHAMLENAGRPVFGYRILTSPLYVVAEFYAMLKTDTGLIDLTPNDRGESFSVFVPDYDIPPDFDYLDRPVTRRYSTYEAPSRKQRVAAEIAAMAPRRVAADRSRATNLGLSLEDMVSLQLVPDPLEASLDLFIECSEELEGLTMAAMDGREAIDVKHLEFLFRPQGGVGGSCR
jgi:hypothetical protein